MNINSVRAMISQISGVFIDDEPLSTRTTLHVGGRPILIAVCSTEEAIIQVTRICEEEKIRPVYIGGGSNIVVGDGDLDFIAIVLANSEISITDTNILAGAGAVWDDFVQSTIEAGYGGLECLSGIPGSVGAAPVQNIGAYGVEVKDILESVKIYNRATGTVNWVPAEELDLAYRHSRLKFQDTEIILAIKVRLDKDALSLPIRFEQLAHALGVEKGERLLASQVRECVLQLRASKGMLYDPADHDTWSAGSFFVNPVIGRREAEKIQESVSVPMPVYDVPSAKEPMVKLSAAWLIEHAGCAKGYPHKEGAPVSLSTKHTLAITNRGSASAKDICALAEEIQKKVKERFSVELHPEPVFILS